MESRLLTVVAEMVAKPGKERELERELMALVAPTRGEEGCVQYDLHVSNDQPGHFLFYENWTGEDALNRHLESPHLQQLRSVLDGLVAQPPRISTFTRLA